MPKKRDFLSKFSKKCLKTPLLDSFFELYFQSNFNLFFRNFLKLFFKENFIDSDTKVVMGNNRFTI